MGLSLRHFLYALIIAVIVYIIREVRRARLRINPRLPDLMMPEAWEKWREGINYHPDRFLIKDFPIPSNVANHVQDDAERNLLEIGRLTLQSDDPRRFVRTAILANATLALQLEAVTRQDEPARGALIKGYEAGMEPLLKDAVRSSTLKWVVLREYSRWKFDDAVKEDWFHEYMHLARPYINEKVRLAREHVLTADSGAGKFLQIYDTLLSELRDRVMKARPKKRFVPPDLPGEQQSEAKSQDSA